MKLNITYNFDTFDDAKKFRLQQAALHAPNTAPQKANKTITENVTSLTQNNTKESNWSFWDFIDLINPLQHIPIINTIYREITGDEIKAPARILGGALFGGAIGAAASIANAIIEDSSGKDAGDHMLALFKDDDTQKHQKTMTASSSDIPHQEPIVEIYGKNFVVSGHVPEGTLWHASHALNGYQKASALAE